MQCTFCGGAHQPYQCPMFGKTQDYIKRYSYQAPTVPAVGEPPRRPPLAPIKSMFSKLFGDGAEPLLQDVLDQPEKFNSDERDLALAILSGTKPMTGLDEGDIELLNGMAYALAGVRMPKVLHVHSHDSMRSGVNPEQPESAGSVESWPHEPDPETREPYSW